MSTPLENGSVLPHGLLGDNSQAMMEGFNKSYKNFPLRVGVVTASYPPSDSRNRSKLTIEYDVVVIEQNADMGATTIQYRNCLSAEGLGSIADYFEKALRFRKSKTTKGDSTNTKGQDGAVVLMLCLDGMSDKGIIIGALTHPDRATNLTDQGPMLVGEYNGVKVTVNKDGSTSLVFRGATDNKGNPIDGSQGNTTLKIEKDGSFQVDHKTITMRLEKSGKASLKAQQDIDVTSDKGNVTVTASSGKVVVNAKQNVEVNTEQNAVVTAKVDATVTCLGVATVEGKTVKLGAGATEAVIKGDTFAKLYNNHVHIGNLGVPTGTPLEPMDPSLSKKVKTE